MRGEKIKSRIQSQALDTASVIASSPFISDLLLLVTLLCTTSSPLWNPFYSCPLRLFAYSMHLRRAFLTEAVPIHDHIPVFLVQKVYSLVIKTWFTSESHTKVDHILQKVWKIYEKELSRILQINLGPYIFFKKINLILTVGSLLLCGLSLVAVGRGNF